MGYHHKIQKNKLQISGKKRNRDRVTAALSSLQINNLINFLLQLLQR